MKQLLFILIILPLFIACSSDNNEIEETQDYTSIIIENKSNSSLFDIVLGTYDGNVYTRFKEIGDVSINDTSKEIVINSDNETRLYVFFIADYLYTYKLNEPITIKPNKKNILTISRTFKATAVSDWTDPTQYPQ